MSIITEYLRWLGHDAGGALPPEDVLAGVLADDAWRLPPNWAPLAPGETLVYVPPQWIGDWESGHHLAPAYQHVWRVPRASLRPLCPPQSCQSCPPSPRVGPYRPSALPPSATGPTARTARTARPEWARAPRERREQREMALPTDAD